MNAIIPIIIFIAMFLLAVIGFAGFDSLKVFSDPGSSINVYFWTHVIAAFLAYFLFAFSFLAGVLYLFQDNALKKHKLIKGPSLEALEKWMFRGLSAGLPLLTLALISGFVWLKNEFGTFWLWNSKLTSSIFAWIVYTALFYFHFVAGIRGRKVVVLAVLAFALILFIFLGMNLFETQIQHYLNAH